MGLDSRGIDCGKRVCGDCEHLESGVNLRLRVWLYRGCQRDARYAKQNVLTILELQSPAETTFTLYQITGLTRLGTSSKGRLYSFLK